MSKRLFSNYNNTSLTRRKNDTEMWFINMMVTWSWTAPKKRQCYLYTTQVYSVFLSTLIGWLRSDWHVLFNFEQPNLSIISDHSLVYWRKQTDFFQFLCGLYTNNYSRYSWESKGYTMCWTPELKFNTAKSKTNSRGN